MGKLIDKTKKYCEEISPKEYFKMYVIALRRAKAWKLIAEGQEKLLVAYRLGNSRPPPDKAFDDIERGRSILKEMENEPGD